MATIINNGCPERGCDAPASAEDRGTVSGVSEKVHLVKTTCVEGHWFLGASDTLLGDE